MIQTHKKNGKHKFSQKMLNLKVRDQIKRNLQKLGKHQEKIDEGKYGKDKETMEAF